MAELTGGQLQILSYWVSSRNGNNNKSSDGAFDSGGNIRWGMMKPKTDKFVLGSSILKSLSISPSDGGSSSGSENEPGKSHDDEDDIIGGGDEEQAEKVGITFLYKSLRHGLSMCCCRSLNITVFHKFYLCQFTRE